MITETIDELIEKADINLSDFEETVTVELADGETVTITKHEYEKLLKEQRSDYGEIFY